MHTAKCAKLIDTVSVIESTGLIVGRVILIHTQSPDWLVTGERKHDDRIASGS